MSRLFWVLIRQHTGLNDFSGLQPEQKVSLEKQMALNNNITIVSMKLRVAAFAHTGPKET